MNSTLKCEHSVEAIEEYVTVVLFGFQFYLFSCSSQGDSSTTILFLQVRKKHAGQSFLAMKEVSLLFKYRIY